MVEKIMKIARVKGVDYDVGRRYDNKQKGGENSTFADALKRVMNKQEDGPSSEIPDAYKLELNSVGTQSLFYFGGLNLNDLLG